MKKNETELIMRLAQVTNNCIGAPPGAKRASYRPCILSSSFGGRSFQSLRGRKPSLRLFPAPSPTQVAPLSPASALRLSAKALD